MVFETLYAAGTTILSSEYYTHLPLAVVTFSLSTPLRRVEKETGSLSWLYHPCYRRVSFQYGHLTVGLTPCFSQGAFTQNCLTLEFTSPAWRAHHSHHLRTS